FASAGGPLSVGQAAKIAQQVILGVEALLINGQFATASVVAAIRPTCIFIDGEGVAKIRPAVPGRTLSWRSTASSLKWFSPEEADGKALDGNLLWHSICFRIGLLMYVCGT
ncbi:unnamed protein product, partial [Polarella glacialis]